MGRFNRKLSLVSYSWTTKQENYFNNEVLRRLVKQRQNVIKWDKGAKKWVFQTAYDEKPAEIWKWEVWGRGMTENGGPYQWASYSAL